MYRHYAEVQGAEVIEVETSADDDFPIDVEAILGACNENSRLIFICSPNNPTGTTLPRKQLEYLLRERGDRSAVVDRGLSKGLLLRQQLEPSAR